MREWTGAGGGEGEGARKEGGGGGEVVFLFLVRLMGTPLKMSTFSIYVAP